MQKLSLAAAAALAIAVPGQPLRAEALMDFTGTVGDLVSGTAGQEIALPYITEQDADGDGIREKIYIRMRVRKAVTGEFLHDTQQRGFDYVQPPCTNPQWVDYSGDAEVLREEGSSRIHFLQTLTAECREIGASENEEAHAAIVYSADVSSASGAVWSLRVDQDAIAFDLADFDGDDTREVALWTETSPGPGSTDLSVRARNAETGEAVSTKKYAVVRP